MMAQAEIMTYAEMEEAFDGEWVLIGEPDLTAMNEVIRGAVLAHDEDRVVVYQALWRLQEEGNAIQVMWACLVFWRHCRMM